jgi:hypothetical protein
MELRFARGRRNPDRPAWPWKRAMLLSTTLAGCFSFGSGPDVGCTLTQPLGLNLNSTSALRFDCATGADAGGAVLLSDPGGPQGAFAKRPSPLEMVIGASPDLSNSACIAFPQNGYAGAWLVAVGAPFRLVETTQTILDEDAGTEVVALPVVPSVATSTPRGWVMNEPGPLGFIVSSDAGVIDATNVLAMPIASLRWLREVGAGPLDGLGTDASADDASSTIAIDASAGDEIALLLIPQGADGLGLAGSIGCTFASSDPARLTVRATGHGAVADALGVGTVSLTATCAGVTGQATITIADGDAGDDASDGDGTSDDGNASDDGDATGDGRGRDGGDAGDTKTPLDAGPADAASASNGGG